jgi:hypothetical protein
MRTGNGSRTKDEPRAVGLRIEKSRLIVTLNDDREVSVPLSWYPTLQRATPSQRKDWELIGPGKGFFWQSLDLDLSVRGLISGLPEVIPAPPRRPPRKRRVARRTLVK